jgi:hypothetical protein
MLEMLISLWFTRTGSTRASSRNNFMEQVFEWGLLECLNLLWLTVSPDGVAVLNLLAGQVLATVEVKTRVSAD